jgi:diguanylate cyclase (GGDEF)-like protein
VTVQTAASHSAPVNIVVVAPTEESRRRIAALVAPALPGAVITPCRRVADLKPTSLERAGIVVCENTAPDHAGLETVRRLRARRPDLPVVLLCADGDPQTVIRALRAGAAGALVPAEYETNLLAESLASAVAARLAHMHRETRAASLGAALSRAEARIVELERALADLHAAAMTDPLTGLANRRAMDRRLDELFSSAQRYGAELSCLMIDVDGLKLCNDALGHAAGDTLLVTLARVLEGGCRRSDVACRVGGDEFVVLLPHTPAAKAAVLARRLQKLLADRTADLRSKLAAASPVVARVRGGRTQHARTSNLPSVCIGVASTALTRPARPADLLHHADTALAAAKNAGPGSVETCSSAGAATAAAAA